MSLGSKMPVVVLLVTFSRIANFQGLPAPMSGTISLKSVERAISIVSNSAPEWWHVLILILKISATSTSTLDGAADTNLHFSLTQMFDDQLDELKKNTDPVSWTPQIEMEFCHAKIYLYALTLTAPAGPDRDDDSFRQMHQETILHRALKAASDLIAEAVKLGLSPVPSPSYPRGILTFAPKFYFTALFSSTTMLFRILGTRNPSIAAQENFAMNSIIEAHKIFQSFPDHRDFIRAAIHIEMMVGALLTQSEGRMMGWRELLVNNRLGASVMFDAVFRAGQYRNRDLATGKSPPVQEWRTMNDFFGKRVPRAPGQKNKDNRIAWDRGVETAGLELGSPGHMAPTRQMPSWLGDWETYMNYFEVGAEVWFNLDQPTNSGEFI